MSKEQSLKALAWNLEGGLSSAITAPRIVKFISDIDPDIAVFSEATTPAGETILADSISPSKYWKEKAPYDDADNRLDTHDLFMIASKNVFRQPEPFRAAGRTCFSAVTVDGGLGVVGMHGFDRDQFSKNGHDKLRVEQMKAVMQHIKVLGVNKVIIAGDLNSMMPGRQAARVLGSLAPFTRILPIKNPGEKRSNIEKIGSLANRMSYMALGGSIRYLQDNGFVNADLNANGTIHFGPIHADLDHFMVRGDVEVSDFSVHPRQEPDHNAISVKIRY